MNMIGVSAYLYRIAFQIIANASYISIKLVFYSRTYQVLSVLCTENYVNIILD